LKKNSQKNLQCIGRIDPQGSFSAYAAYTYGGTDGAEQYAMYVASIESKISKK
jgi:hypothetical protein